MQTFNSTFKFLHHMGLYKFPFTYSIICLFLHSILWAVHSKQARLLTFLKTHYVFFPLSLPFPLVSLSLPWNYPYLAFSSGPRFTRTLCELVQKLHFSCSDSPEYVSSLNLEKQRNTANVTAKLELGSGALGFLSMTEVTIWAKLQEKPEVSVLHSNSYISDQK